MNTLLILGFALGAATSPPTDNTLTLTVDTDVDTYLSAAHCDADTLAANITFALAAHTTKIITFSATDELYVWWRTGDDCADLSTELLVNGHKLNQTDDDTSTTIPLVHPEIRLNFPEDVQLEEFASLTYQDVFNRSATDPCTEEVNETTKVLCIAVDSSASTEDTTTINLLNEAWTALSFVIDTMAPAAPTITSSTPYDGSITINVSIDEEFEIETWKLYIQPLDTSSSTDEDTTADCTAWGVTPIEYDSVTRVSTTDATTDALEYTAANGVAYEFCVTAIDLAGNEGAASAIATGNAQEECDFIECYPGDLKDGHCAAAPASLWWLVGLGLLIRRRRGGQTR